ncbi:MAG TPA: hypothetical protein VF746_15770 [Longimicrobium sp.]|jgi:hypothetical protein
MVASGRRGPWPAVRAAVRRELERTSLRKLAKKIGVNSTTLHGFVTLGSTPQARNADKLLAWYNALAPARRGGPPARARIVSAMLVEGLPDAERGPVLAAVASAVWDAHARRGTTPPEWVAWLREHGEPPPDEEDGDGEDGRADE